MSLTRKEWLSQVRDNEEALRSLILAYHPASRGEKKELKITAVNAEAACGVVRKAIEEEYKGKGRSPIETFEFALQTDQWYVINQLLNDAWFGVPESTDCWNIKGFKEAVELMEDLPE